MIISGNFIIYRKGIAGMANHKSERGYGMGILINNAGRGNYTNKDSVQNLIHYITRADGSSKEGEGDVLCTGAYGAVDFLGTAFTITQFEDIQSCYIRAGKKARYADHEIFTFSSETSRLLNENPKALPELARQMAAVISDGQYQVYYGVHAGEKKLHIHFAVNTVNFCTLHKRQETKAAVSEHEKQLQELIAETIIKQ